MSENEFEGVTDKFGTQVKKGQTILFASKSTGLRIGIVTHMRKDGIGFMEVENWGGNRFNKTVAKVPENTVVLDDIDGTFARTQGYHYFNKLKACMAEDGNLDKALAKYNKICDLMDT